MKNAYIPTHRGVYSEGFDEIGWGATALSLPDFMASMHFRLATRLTAWTKARCLNASKLLESVIWCRELIVERIKVFGVSILKLEWSFYTPTGYIRLQVLPVQGLKLNLAECMMVGCGHGPRFFPNVLPDWLALGKRDPLNSNELFRATLCWNLSHIAARVTWWARMRKNFKRNFKFFKSGAQHHRCIIGEAQRPFFLSPPRLFNCLVVGYQWPEPFPTSSMIVVGNGLSTTTRFIMSFLHCQWLNSSTSVWFFATWSCTPSDL